MICNQNMSHGTQKEMHKALVLYTDVYISGNWGNRYG
jgi:hypothetical protein